MYSSISKLDRDIARSFLNAPTNTISYRPMAMRNEQNQTLMIPSPSIDYKENLYDDFVPQPHPKAQLGYPTNTNIIPMYYDVIVDTVTDYDIFYPIAKERKKYYYCSNNDQESITDENSIYPPYHVQRLDELAVSIDFPHDIDSITNPSNQNQQVSYEPIHPIKNVRFNDNPTWIPYSRNNIKNTSLPVDQYYFQPEIISPIDNQQSSVRYITTPFFWFRPVLNRNYAICIPTSRPSLHAYITPSYNPPLSSSQFQLNSTPNPVQL